MQRTLVSALLLLCAALLVVGLTLSKSTAGRADFTFVNGAEPKTLDPHIMTGEPEGRIAEALFEGLAKLDAKTLEPVPGSAESWEITTDGKRYTFHIRANARWSDGHPLTAHDFVYAWRRLQDPKTGAEYAYIMHMVRYAEGVNKRRDAEAARHFGVDGGVFATDDHTLVVELVAPTPYFLELTAFYPFFPLPRWAIERAPTTWFLPGKLVGNGAFTLESWRVGDRLRFARNPLYWGHEHVKLNSIEAISTENLTTALNLYLTDEVDWLPHGTYPQELAPELKRRGYMYIGPALISYYYRINCTRKPFTDARVRKAINLAIDREQITRDVVALGQKPALHFVPAGIRGYEQPVSELRYDPEQARTLLAEAGFPGGKGFPKFGILFNTAESHKKLAEVIADQLRRNLGIEVAAYNQEWQSYLQATRQLDYDVARAGWVGDYEDPNTFLDLFVTGGGNNQTGWGNPAYDQFVKAAGNVERFLESPDSVLQHARDRQKLERLTQAVEATSDAPSRLAKMAELRLAILAEAESILVRDEFPIIPIYDYVVAGMVKPNVKGFYKELVGSDGKARPNLRDRHPLDQLSMQPGAPQ